MQISLAQIFDIVGKLRDARAQLDQLNALMRSDPEFARQHGRQVAQSEQAYGDAVSKYQGFRVLVGLDQVPGLWGGLGAVPVAVAAGKLLVGVVAAAKFALAVTAVVLLYKLLPQLVEMGRLWQERKFLVEQNRGIMLQQSGGLRQQAQGKRQQVTVAQSQGRFDDARQFAAEADDLDRRADALQQQSGRPGDFAPEGFLSWFQNNWYWLALAGGAIVIGPRIIDNFTD